MDIQEIQDQFYAFTASTYAWLQQWLPKFANFFLTYYPFVLAGCIVVITLVRHYVIEGMTWMTTGDSSQGKKKLIHRGI